MRIETIFAAVVCLALGVAGGFTLGNRSAKAELGQIKAAPIVTPAPLPTEEPTIAAVQETPSPEQSPSAAVRKSYVGVDLMKILQDVRLKKFVAEGEARGVQMTKLRSGSMFEKLGFREGDVVLSVEGLSIAAPKTANSESLPGADRLTITILRDNKEIKRTLRLAP